MAQFSAGVEAIEQQLVVMGIRSSPRLDPSSNIVRVLIDSKRKVLLCYCRATTLLSHFPSRSLTVYVDIGDHIALQYGGSEAHKKVSAERSESIVGPIGKVGSGYQPPHPRIHVCQSTISHCCIEPTYFYSTKSY